MSVSIAEFWKLAVESKLLSADDARKYNDAFARAKGGAVSDADLQRLVKSLISSGVVSRYQAKVLLAGRAGPFVYGDYQIFDRLEAGRLSGVFRARHLATRHPVCLYFLSGPGLQDPQALARLAPQATAAETASRDQPHLAHCYHWSDLGGYKFVVLEDLHGESAADRLTAKGKLAAEDACRMVRQAAIGLECLYKQQPATARFVPRICGWESTTRSSCWASLWRRILLGRRRQPFRRRRTIWRRNWRKAIGRPIRAATCTVSAARCFTC